MATGNIGIGNTSTLATLPHWQHFHTGNIPSPRTLPTYSLFTITYSLFSLPVSACPMLGKKFSLSPLRVSRENAIMSGEALIGDSMIQSQITKPPDKIRPNVADFPGLGGILMPPGPVLSHRVSRLARAPRATSPRAISRCASIPPGYCCTRSTVASLNF